MLQKRKHKRAFSTPGDNLDFLARVRSRHKKTQPYFYRNQALFLLSQAWPIQSTRKKKHSLDYRRLLAHENTLTMLMVRQVALER